MPHKVVNKEDSEYMMQALKLAKKAYAQGEIPIGALVVTQEGVVLGKGYNLTEHRCSQSSHAEVRAIEQAGRKLGDWRLDGCTLYVTLQPCLMCLGLLCLSRITRLVYGARSPLFGYDLDNEVLPCLYKKHIRGVTSGVMEEESKKLLEQFFKVKRKTGDQF